MAKAKAPAKIKAKAKAPAKIKAKAEAPAKARVARSGMVSAALYMRHRDILGEIAARARQANAGDTVVYIISEEDYNAITEMAEG